MKLALIALMLGVFTVGTVSTTAFATKEGRKVASAKKKAKKDKKAAAPANAEMPATDAPHEGAAPAAPAEAGK